MADTYVVLDTDGDILEVTDPPEKAYGPHEGEEADDGKRKYTRTFVVRTNNKLADVEIVLANQHLPRIGDIWATKSSNVPGMRCVHRRASRDPECPVLWTVTCDYDSRQSLAGQDAKNPLDRPAVVSYRFETYTEALEKAFDPDNPDTEIDIVNSAGDPYDPPLEVERGRLIITIKKNMASYNSERARAFIYTVNKTEWWGYEPLSALMTDYSASPEREDVITFWPTTWQIKIHRTQWVKEILDMGVREIDGGTRQPILERGHPVQSPVLLDGVGTRLPIGGVPLLNRFLLYPRAEFNDLNLP